MLEVVGIPGEILGENMFKRQLSPAAAELRRAKDILKGGDIFYRPLNLSHRFRKLGNALHKRLELLPDLLHRVLTLPRSLPHLLLERVTRLPQFLIYRTHTLVDGTHDFLNLLLEQEKCRVLCLFRFLAPQHQKNADETGNDHCDENEGFRRHSIEI